MALTFEQQERTCNALIQEFIPDLSEFMVGTFRDLENKTTHIPKEDRHTTILCVLSSLLALEMATFIVPIDDDEGNDILEAFVERIKEERSRLRRGYLEFCANKYKLSG